mgnify:CR=1 FL=1
METIQQTSKGTWQAVIVQQKTKRPDYKPVIQQALQLCGERPNDEESLVFEGLTDASWISRPLKVWIEASGIKKHITFHMARHTYATQTCISQGVPIETLSKLMGHCSIQTTQIYAKITNQKVNEDMKKLSAQINGKYLLTDDKIPKFAHNQFYK